MAFRFDIPRGSTQSQLMSAEYCGASILVRYFNAGGTQIQPTAEGTISVSTTEALEDFVTVNPVGPGLWLINGPILRVRLTITGTGAATASAQIWRYGSPMDLTPPGLYSGLRAAIGQSYTEANVKVGRQYEASWNVPVLGNGAVASVSFVTGASPVIVKSRIVKFNGTSLITRVYRGPTFTPGMNIPYANLNDRNPVTGGVVVTLDPTVTAVGTEIAAPSYDIGTNGQGNSTFGTYSFYGGERVLRPNTAYLLQTLNDSGASQRVSGYISWYEGGTDLPLRQ